MILRPGIVASLVPSYSRVLDLGCDDGLLLRHFITTRDCLGTGIELDHPSLVTGDVGQSARTGVGPQRGSGRVSRRFL